MGLLQCSMACQRASDAFLTAGEGEAMAMELHCEDKDEQPVQKALSAVSKHIETGMSQSSITLNAACIDTERT